MIEDFILELGGTVGHVETGGAYHMRSKKGMLRSLRFKLNNNNYIFEENVGGCGSLTMGGNAYIKESDIKLLKKVFEKFKNNNVGAIFAVLGQNYYDRDCEKQMLALGFEMIAEYNNYQHGSEYTQRQYILKL